MKSTKPLLAILLTITLLITATFSLTSCSIVLPFEEDTVNAKPSKPEVHELGWKIGDICPSQNLNLIDGSGEISISALRGKTVVINFWGTWCGPCVSELPHFNKLASEYKDSVSVLAVHTSDNISTTASPEEFVETYYPESEIFFAKDTPDKDNQYLDEYYLELGGTGSYPMTVILDTDGIIVFRRVGAMTYDELVAAINLAKE